MNTLARRLAYILAPLALACAACVPAATSETDRAAATAPAAAVQPADITITGTAYPPPMQTAKSIAATERTARDRARETAAAVGRDKPITATDMVRYANPVLGLSFAYPRELGEVDFGVHPGDTGESWYLGFSHFDAFWLAGVSPDYSQGRGAGLGDTYGYVRGQDGSVRWLDVPSHPTGSEIEVEETMTSESGVEIVFFLVPPRMGEPEDSASGPPAVLVNLAGDHFPGLVVVNSDSARLPAETLRAILHTIEVSEPTQKGGATGTPPGS